MSARLRLGVSGAGRVFERLYLPALRLVPGVELVAIADPVRERRTSAGGEVEAFGSLAALLEGASVDAVAVLSPPPAHVEDALAAVGRGLPVLVEKPMCLSLDEVERLRGWASLVTPAFSRRYWPAYQQVAASGPVRHLQLAIAVDPESWDAYSGTVAVTDDLFPHVADLARWLTRSEVTAIRARQGARSVEAELVMASGGRCLVRFDTGRPYREALRADGKTRHVGPPNTMASALRRATRREDPAVEAVAAMLRDWCEAIGGARPQALPTFEDGRASVAAVEQLRAALGS